MMDCDGSQDQVVGDPQVRRGRGKLSLQPGQEREDGLHVLQGLDRSSGWMQTIPFDSNQLIDQLKGLRNSGKPEVFQVSLMISFTVLSKLTFLIVS